MALPTPSMDVKNFHRSGESLAFEGLTENQFTFWIYGTDDTPAEVKAAEYFARVANTDDTSNSSPNKQFGNLLAANDLIYVPQHGAFYKVSDADLGTVVDL